MQVHSNTSDARQELLDECMPFLENIARRWARNTPHYEVEDLVQEGALHILETYEHMPADIREPRRYLVTGAKFRIIEVVTRRQYEISLDAPIADDSKYTYLDRLACPASQPPDDLPCSPAFTRALHTLDTSQQEMLAKYYHLDFEILTGKESANRKYYPAHPTARALTQRRFRACQKLRANEQLRQAVCS